MFQLLTDSECGLAGATLKAHHVAVIPFHFTVNGHTIASDLDDNQQLEDFYTQLKQGVQPSTAAINVGEYVTFFKPYVQAGTPILFMGLSSGLSSSFHNAELARDLLLEDYPDADIRVVDTLAACAGEGRLLLEAIHLQAAGNDLDTTVAWLTAHRLQLQQWFTVDSLQFLYHGGRISRASATVGTLLQIKPLLDVDPQGKLRVVDKIRARHHALAALTNKVTAALHQDVRQPVLIATSGDWAAAKRVRDAVLTQYPAADLRIGPIGPTIACHTGFGCVAVFVTGLTDRN
ncbi:DegV family protein [Levilactobacillus zymae]|uniref:DegV family protein n=1 Tax=Levilactobacillus zymae TaxID=267363 RepID=UPI0028B65C71|nr:DegV family protein [Levilactobacillus zymae]MDT6981328.1 DegV family protein [Levilactobacillus zymae]